MSIEAPRRDFALRSKQLEQGDQHFEKDLDLRKQELNLKRIESKRNRWANPTVAAAVVAAGASVFGYVLADRQSAGKLDLANREFCYKALSEHLNKHPAVGPNRASTELSLVAAAIDDKNPCPETLREVANNLRSTAPPPAASAAQPPLPACGGTKSIRELGWREGHKTKFCNAQGYDGVFNPYGDYSAGGFCYKGPLDSCLEGIKRASGR